VCRYEKQCQDYYIQFSVDIFETTKNSSLVTIVVDEKRSKHSETRTPSGNRQFCFHGLAICDNFFMAVAPVASAGHASLTGAQHYLTFDRRFFEFAGECSYLLARDFIGGTFSVVVNYDRPVRNMPVKKSLSIITAGKQIEVFPDAKVTIDGIRVEMPARIGNATVMRRGNLISVSDDWRGIDVTCDLPHDHCTLSVSG
jgi:hypothetical protein